MNNFKLMKVFDCQFGMPDDVQKAFFNIHDNAHNDCYISYCVADSAWEEPEGHDYILLDNWLLENGASKLEQVLIKHWW